MLRGDEQQGENENPAHTGRWSGANQRRPHAVSPLFYYHAYSRRAQPFFPISLSLSLLFPSASLSLPLMMSLTLSPALPMSFSDQCPVSRTHNRNQLPLYWLSLSLSLLPFSIVFHIRQPLHLHTGIDPSLYRHHLSRPQLMVGRLPIYSALPSTRTNYHQRMTIPPFVYTKCYIFLFCFLIKSHFNKYRKCRVTRPVLTFQDLVAHAKVAEHPPTRKKHEQTQQ